MGGALLEGWLQRGIKASDITIVEPNPDIREMLSTDHGVQTCASRDDIPTSFVPNVIMFAVKPQVMDEVAPLYASFKGSDCVYLSIAAGKAIDYF